MTRRSSSRSPGRGIALGFGVSLALVFLLGTFSFFALHRSVEADRVAFEQANELIEFGLFQSAIERKMTTFRGYLLSGEERYLEGLESSRLELKEMLARLKRDASGKELRLLEGIVRAEEEHQKVVERAVAMRRSGKNLLGARVATAGRQVNRLARLIDSLLDISRITEGRLDIEGEPVDLAALVRDALARTREELDRAGCAVTLRLEGTSHIGQWDRTRLEQIVANLLSNAAKYGAGRPVEVTVASDSETSRLTVRDHGIGIAPEHQARIFGHFEKAVSARHYSGLGLGLWIVRQVVEAHGGTISVESAPGEGAAFTIELPRRLPTPRTAESAADPASADG